MRRVTVAAMLVMGVGVGAWGPATAQEAVDSAARVLSGLRACKALPDTERLACYDRAAAALDQAVAQKDVTLIDRQEVRRTRRGLFGFTLPRIGIFSDDENKEEAEEFAELNTTVASARSVDGRVEFRLGDGSDAVWRTTDPVAFPPKAGTAVRIRRASLGSYFVKFGKDRMVRGMRIR